MKRKPLATFLQLLHSLGITATDRGFGSSYRDLLHEGAAQVWLMEVAPSWHVTLNSTNMLRCRVSQLQRSGNKCSKSNEIPQHQQCRDSSMCLQDMPRDLELYAVAEDIISISAAAALS